MSGRRIHVERPPEAGVAALDARAARHAIRVLRLGDGDPVVLFDGAGRTWRGTIRRARRGNVLVDVGEAIPEPPPSGPRIVLATGIPKGKRLSRLVAGVTEAGVDALVFVVGRRAAVRSLSAPSLERAARTAVQAARQSGRTWVPTLEGPSALDGFLTRTIRAGELRLLATAAGNPPPIACVADGLRDAQTVLLLVGPEGGFNEDEETAARFAGFRPVSLGPHVMRVETAGTVAVALVRALAAAGRTETAPAAAGAAAGNPVDDLKST